jgi:hypothetical protein
MKINLLGLLLVFTLLACSRKPIFITSEKTTIRDTTIFLPSAIVRDTIPHFVYINGERITYEKVITDTSSLVKLRIYYDNALRQVIAECKAEPRIITIRDTLYRQETKIVPMQAKDDSWFDWKVLIIIGFILIMGLWLAREGIRTVRNV